MIAWTGIFFAIATISAIFGFGERATASTDVARTIFYVFAPLSAVTALCFLLRAASGPDKQRGNVETRR